MSSADPVASPWYCLSLGALNVPLQARTLDTTPTLSYPAPGLSNLPYRLYFTALAPARRRLDARRGLAKSLACPPYPILVLGGGIVACAT